MISNVIKPEQMIILASCNPSTGIQLNPDAMFKINNFLMGQIHIVCFQGFASKRYQASQLIGKSTLRTSSLDNCLMIRPNPVLEPRTQKYTYFLELISSVPQAKQKLHLLATFISNVIVVAIDNGEQVGYLGSVYNKITHQNNNNNNFSSSPRNPNKLSSKNMKTASLVCMQAMPSQNQQFIIDSTDKLISRFGIEGIQNQVLKSYPIVRGLQCSQRSLQRSTVNFQDKMMQQIQVASTYEKGNTELMYGRILVKYIQNLTQQINSQKHQINPQTAQQNIVIDQGYEAYMAGVQQFHNSSLALIDRNQRPDDNQLQQMLDVAKTKALQTFYAKGGSTNLQYRQMLENYISHKDREVVENYSQQEWNRNLQILQSQSKTVLDKIQQSRTRDPATITSYISQMRNNYQIQARGPQKYYILNDYMKVFTPIAYEADPEKQQQLRRQMARNQELQQRLAELKKRKGGCCGSCGIM